MLALLGHPDQRAQLASDRSLMEPAVEEMLRWVTPIKNMARTVMVDIELARPAAQGGRRHHDALSRRPTGTNTTSTTRSRFDIDRDPNHHLAFGFGTHFCLGSSLARIELRQMFDTVLDRLPDLELAVDRPLHHRASNFISGPEEMPVRFTPTPARGAA